MWLLISRIERGFLARTYGPIRAIYLLTSGPAAASQPIKTAAAGPPTANQPRTFVQKLFGRLWFADPAPPTINTCMPARSFLFSLMISTSSHQHINHHQTVPAAIDSSIPRCMGAMHSASDVTNVSANEVTGATGSTGGADTDFTSAAATKPAAKPAAAKSAIDSAASAIDSDIIPNNGLGDLINSLKSLLNGQGLSSLDIDIEEIQRLMESYESKESDWSMFAHHDSSRNYTRNGIININGNANLLLLCWSPGKGSAIHDHANAHCCMKILKGHLNESLYEMPKLDGSARDQESCDLHLRQITTLLEQQVGYISDDIGLHKISNPTDEVAVSLHLYTPPYASLYGCSMYDIHGKKHHVDMSKYYSWQGKLVGGDSQC